MGSAGVGPKSRSPGGSPGGCETPSGLGFGRTSEPPLPKARMWTSKVPSRPARDLRSPLIFASLVTGGIALRPEPRPEYYFRLGAKFGTRPFLPASILSRSSDELNPARRSQGSREREHLRPLATSPASAAKFGLSGSSRRPQRTAANGLFLGCPPVRWASVRLGRGAVLHVRSASSMCVRPAVAPKVR